MRMYTYSEARQHFAEVLDSAQRDGGVKIKRRDGRVYLLKPELFNESPLEVKGVDLEIEAEEIVNCVREGRRT